jgi:5-methylthioadenosine/S-adenosylhomocysteine deaminase
MPKRLNSSNLARQLGHAFFVTIFLSACSPSEPPVEPSTGTAKSDDRRSVDIIVSGDYIVTMDATDTILENAAVAIDEGLIVAIGAASEIDRMYVAIERLGGENRVVMPGLINGHSHAAMTLLRGVADDLGLMDWLTNYIFPAEVQFVDADFVRIGTELACWEMIRGGTTTFVDMYYYPDIVAEAVESCGMRALVSATVIDQRSPDAEGAADSIGKGLEFVTRWKNRSSRITPIFGPHANYTLNAEQLAATRAAATEAGVAISMHIAESPFEVQYSKDTYGMTTIDLLESIGFLDEPTIAAHVIWPSESEIAILAERNVGVIHNPTSNMKIASGIAPVSAMLAAGVHVGLGTDGAASNNDLDMWEEMRLASFLQKIEQMDSQVLPAKTVLAMATRGGAEAIGLGGQIGALEVGMKADVIQVAFDDVHHIPVFDVISHLVYVNDEQDVITTIVDGKVLMREGEILTVDTASIAREARALAALIQSALAERNQ